MDLYSEMPWEVICGEVAKLKIAIRDPQDPTRLSQSTPHRSVRDRKQRKKKWSRREPNHHHGKTELPCEMHPCIKSPLNIEPLLFRLIPSRSIGVRRVWAPLGPQRLRCEVRCCANSFRISRYRDSCCKLSSRTLIASNSFPRRLVAVAQIEASTSLVDVDRRGLPEKGIQVLATSRDSQPVFESVGKGSKTNEPSLSRFLTSRLRGSIPSHATS